VDLLSEADQLQHLPQLSALLSNPWFKHLIATWLAERDRCRVAVCTFPVTDVGQVVTMLQTRGEANAYDRVVNTPYEEYAKLVEEAKEHERSSRTTS
jgi:hypothetical protein